MSREVGSAAPTAADGGAPAATAKGAHAIGAGPPPASAQRVDVGTIDPRAWAVLVMLFLFMLVNFMDKAVLGLAAQPIMRDLKLSHTQFGQLGTSFFFLFSLSSVVVGALSNRWSTKWILGVMGVLWALAQIPLLWASAGTSMLLFNRIALGAGEGPANPMAMHALYSWFPNERRPLPTSLINIGSAIGLGVAAPAITVLILGCSWHVAFFALGLLSLLWSAAWILIGRDGPLLARPSGAARPGGSIGSTLRLLRTPTVMGSILIYFAAYWVLALVIVWLPNYLHVAAGFSEVAVSWIVVLPSLVQVVLNPLISLLSERLKARGVSSRVSRGVLASAALALASGLIILLPFTHGAAAIVTTTMAFSVGSIVFSLAVTLVAEVARDPQRGGALGCLSALGSLAGVFAPTVMGLFIDGGVSEAEGFRRGFVAVGLAVFIAAVIGGAMINPERDIARRRLSRGLA